MPQESKQICSDNRSCCKISWDEQNDDMDMRSPVSDHLQYKSEENMDKGQEGENKDNINNSNAF